jgi:hypothetical protein
VQVQNTNTLKIIGKIATFFSAASAVFVVLSAVWTYEFVLTASSGAPASYVVLYVLLNLTPYLFVMVLSLVVAVVCRGAEKEVPPPVDQPQAEVKPKEETEF